MACHSDPAIMVKRAIAEHLEVLRVALLLRFGVSKTVHHADAFDRLLRDAVEFRRGGNACCLQNRGDEIDHVVELVADAAFVLDACRPRDDHWIARAAEVRSDLLAPVEGGIRGPSPTD